jgi:hypothetical protein
MPKATARHSATSSAARGGDQQAKARAREEEEMPRSGEELRLAVLARGRGGDRPTDREWRSCRPACRRHHICAYLVNCTHARARKPSTPEREAAALTQFRRTLIAAEADAAEGA